MSSFIRTASLVLIAGLSLAGVSQAEEILVNENIATSTTWTANNRYNLQKQIYVLPGATLTIEAGTVLASTTNIGGSLAVCRGAKIYVNGTESNPVVMTSTADVSTWVGSDAKTGTWREAANEWGNLTLMGNGYVSENAIATNTPAPNASNYANMEGLVPENEFDTKTRYGGGDDEDDSGSIQYVSLRYGGKVVNLNVELNGLSLGGIGRETDIHHVDIMNNVDDGIEIWGGTVNLKYFSIWNIGDDSFDVDQGWRGKAQFGLIVQGYSRDAGQGSGVGDNIFEADGAEQSDYQPVTTATIYNVTVIGQPTSGAGDHATAWRDNARVQYRNCIFMDLGERLVSADNVDGDGGLGYGVNGTLSWADTWTTSYNVRSAVNSPSDPEPFYQAQIDGRLAEITDSVMFRNLHAQAYTEANNRDVFNPLNNNVLIPGSAEKNSPIQSIVRGPAVTRGGTTQTPVIGLDPRPKNEALESFAAAPDDGFFTEAYYRGAFAPEENWLCNWTAAHAFGFSIAPPSGCSGSVISIVESTPARNAIDARQPSNINGSNPTGISQIVLHFDGAADGLVAGDFTVTTNPVGAAPSVLNVLSNGNDATVTLDSYIPAGKWTIITHNASGTSTRIGYLPADVNNDRTSSPVDILKVIDHLNGAVNPPYAIYQTDIDRSNFTNPADILRVIDLLNGADAFESWNGRTLNP